MLIYPFFSSFENIFKSWPQSSISRTMKKGYNIAYPMEQVKYVSVHILFTERLEQSQL